MPGLLRGMARTAVVAGTATAVSNRVSRRQANKWAEQDYQPPYRGQPQGPPQEYQQQAPPPPPAAPAGEDRVKQLQDLAALKDQGVLTDEEFAHEKARILGS
jgi:hypothetical protein